MPEKRMRGVNPHRQNTDQATFRVYRTADLPIDGNSRASGKHVLGVRE